MFTSVLLRGVSAGALAFAFATSTSAQEALPTIDVGSLVGGPSGAPSGPAEPQTAGPQPQKPFSRPLAEHIPAVVATVTAKQFEEQSNAITATDTIKYLPSIDLRSRYEGEQNQMIGFRTVSEDTPAQSLVYVDGMLVSNLLGNYYYYPPVTQVVTPNEIARADVVYGPFSALYPGNSYGGVLTFTTRMPEKLEVHAAMKGFDQRFDLYQTGKWFPGWNGSFAAGDRWSNLSAWFTYDHLTTNSQPLQFAGLLPASGYVYGPINAYGGAGWLSNINQFGLIAGANSQYTQEQDLYKLKLAYDFMPTTRLTYTGAFIDLHQYAGVQSYIYDSFGLPIYNSPTGAITNAGVPYYIYGENPSLVDDRRLMQGLELKSDTRGPFDYDLVASHLLYLSNNARQSTNYGIDTTGQNWNQSGSGWITADARGVWRPEQDVFGRHEISFGGHFDQYALRQYFSWTPVWTSFNGAQPNSESRGITQTKALYLQDAWSFLPNWKLVVGGREEFWSAYDGAGLNYAPLPAGVYPSWGTVPQTNTWFPSRSASAFSPKAALSYQATPDLALRASFGNAKRFPTVSELYQYQAFTYGTIVNNPNLLPEQVNSYDLTGEYSFGKNVARLTYVHEDRWNEIVSQTFQVTGAPITGYQNVAKSHFNGVEGAIELKDVATPGLDVNASVTYVGATVLSDPQYNDPNFAALPWLNYPALNPAGKNYPLIPRWRAKWVVTYHPTEQWSVSGAMRYASNPYYTLDNADYNHATFGSMSGYLIFDARATYKFDKNWSVAAGVNNIGNYHQYDYHPFEQRTFFAELRYDFK